MVSNIFIAIFGPNSCQLKKVLEKERIFGVRHAVPPKILPD